VGQHPNSDPEADWVEFTGGTVGAIAKVGVEYFLWVTQIFLRLRTHVQFVLVSYAVIWENLSEWIGCYRYYLIWCCVCCVQVYFTRVYRVC
jgi:hypothetical protein